MPMMQVSVLAQLIALLWTVIVLCRFFGMKKTWTDGVQCLRSQSETDAQQ